MKITDAQKQSYLLQEMGRTRMLGSQTLERKRFKYFLNNLTSTPPEGCKFKVGDKVVYNNDNKIKFTMKVLGFNRNPRYPGATIFLTNREYWRAVTEDCIQPA